MFRRLVVGLAVAAFIAPAAQARVDDLGAGTQADQSAQVIQGDDEVLAPSGDGSTVLIHGDDKVIFGQPGDTPVLIHGDDKVFAPSQTPDAVPIASSPSTFDWRDAFIGAGVALALLLLVGTAFGSRRRTRPAAA